MATRTVKPSGGDYTSLSAWEAGRQADITGLGPEIAECSGNLSDTTQVTIDGWTTTASDYIQVITPQVDRHAGVWDGAKYRLEVAAVFNFPLRILESFVRVEGVQIRQSSTNADAYAAIRSEGGGSGDIRIEACLIRSVGGNAASGGGLRVAGSGTQTVRVRTCVIYAISQGPAIQEAMGFTGSPVLQVDNCTLIGATHAINRGDAGAVTARNCYAHGGTDAYTGTMTRTTCAHSSATSFSGSTASIAHSTANFTNVTGGSENYHLVSGASATLLTGGTDLSADFTLDIDGETRVDWGVGADEYITAGGGATDNGWSGAGWW